MFEVGIEVIEVVDSDHAHPHAGEEFRNEVIRIAEETPDKDANNEFIAREFLAMDNIGTVQPYVVMSEVLEG